MSKQKVMIGNVCSATQIEVDLNANGGSTVIVDDNGVTIVPAADTLNFTGSGVTVTTGSPGEANIAIPGPSELENGEVDFSRGGPTTIAVVFVHGPYSKNYRWTCCQGTTSIGSGIVPPQCWTSDRTSFGMNINIAGTETCQVSWSVSRPNP